MSTWYSEIEIVRVDPDFADLIPSFLENREEEIGLIKDSAARGDYREVMRLGHGMKGVGTGYGFPEISVIGKAIEEAALREDRPAIEREVERLAEYLAAVEVVEDTK